MTATQQRFWYAAHTKPNSERFAELALQEQGRGYTVYNPKILCRVSHAGRVLHVERPFLPRYILVLADGRGAREVRAAPGVANVVCCGDCPALVLDAEVDQIRRREIVVKDKETGKEKRYVDLGGLYLDEREFRRNEVVRISGGPFVGFNALFECKDDAFRAMVFLDLMGRKTKVTVDLNNLEKTNAKR